MKRLTIIVLITSFLFFSCNRSAKKIEPIPEMPKALQEKSNTETFFSKKRYDEDMVESLYAELAEKAPELKSLEETIFRLKDQKNDTIETFEKFGEKNTTYYNSAEKHIMQIKDSLLRQRIKTMIDNSIENYNRRIANHKNLILALDSKEVNLQDLHQMLKLVKTLSVLEKFQKENVPSTKSLENVILDYNKTIQKTDTFIKK
jgi:predicted RNase H-like nuclease (RuvC/YqgF family)